MPRRPCLGIDGQPPCPHLAPTGKARCQDCDRATDRARGTKQQRGYDTDYERERAALHLETRPPCHWCGAPATTADHVPPLAVPAGHRVLMPACATCNYGHRAGRSLDTVSEAAKP